MFTMFLLFRKPLPGDYLTSALRWEYVDTQRPYVPIHKKDKRKENFFDQTMSFHAPKQTEEDCKQKTC